MRVSIITVVFNGEPFLESCILSVLSQDYSDIEYILIDGGSKDRSVEIIKKYEDKLAFWISEKDSGIYDAINKGLKRATGDIIGILNSDDFFAGDTAVSRIVSEFESKKTDCVFADLVYVDPKNEKKTVRYYSARNFVVRHFKKGDMPPHPTFYARRELYEKFGYFNDTYRICADFELMIRFLFIGRSSFSYIPQVLIKMRTGGISTRGLKSTIEVNREMLRACRENGIKTNYLRIYSKYFSKIWQLIRRP